MTVFLLLPAYNEEKALPSLLGKVKGMELKVIAVDDGSTDRTAEVVARHCSVLLRHEKNKGLGEALRTGFDYVAKNAADDDMIVTMDADDTHDPALIPSMLQRMKDFDIVIASRYCKGGKQTGVGFLRAFLSRAMSLFLGLVFPVRGASDYSSGYRAYKAGILKHGLQIESRGFACMPEILVKLAAAGARVTEIPLVMHYELKKSGSKFNPFNLIVGYISLFFLLRSSLKQIANSK